MKKNAGDLNPSVRQANSDYNSFEKRTSASWACETDAILTNGALE
jgi:hypothetical protein